MDQAEENLNSRSLQGATFLPGVQNQFPWKLGQIPSDEETNRAGFKFSFNRDDSNLARGGEAQEPFPLLFAATDSRTSGISLPQPSLGFSFCVMGWFSPSICGVLRQCPGLVQALEPCLPRELYLASQSSISQMIIWDLRPVLALVSI